MQDMLLPDLPGGHPFSSAVAAARFELEAARRAALDGNHGKARVCSRRAVAAFLQGVAGHLPFDAGTHAPANLRAVMGYEALPQSIRDAAERLSGGARSIVAGTAYSVDPVADALLVIHHFLAAGAH